MRRLIPSNTSICAHPKRAISHASKHRVGAPVTAIQVLLVCSSSGGDSRRPAGDIILTQV
jgi:hypothetical protein